jgi:hypothetical protein
MTDNLKIRDFLNMEAVEETPMFIRSTSKKTSAMKYNEFVKHSLEKFRPILQEFLDEVDSQMKACKNEEELKALKIPALPDNIRNEIIDHIDKQKSLNIVEKTYLCLDMLRAFSSEIAKVAGTAGMHYMNAFKALHNLTGSGGGRILGLNGEPLK